MGYSLLQLSLEEEIEVRSSLAAIEIEERRKGRKENELQGKEEKLKQKAKEIKSTTREAKWVAAQLQLMAGQLDCLANQILEKAKK